MEDSTLDLYPDMNIEPLYLPEIKEEEQKYDPHTDVAMSILQVEITVQQLRERVKHLELQREIREIGLFPLQLI